MGWTGLQNTNGGLLTFHGIKVNRQLEFNSLKFREELHYIYRRGSVNINDKNYTGILVVYDRFVFI